MRKRIEKTYGSTVRGILKVINPVKKKIIKTYCIAHRFINNQAVDILKNEGYREEYEYYKKYIHYLNKGVVWADQDLKSANHFFHYIKEEGLYGFSNALNECMKYYKKALCHIKKDEIEAAMFYLGAACHLVQDASVPQHVSNDLLKQHRRFELWIIDKIVHKGFFTTMSGVIQYDKIEDYVRNNARNAYSVYEKYKNVEKREERFEKIAEEIIINAQSTTAGLLLKFYNKEIRK
jgi:phospholipase C